MSLTLRDVRRRPQQNQGEPLHFAWTIFQPVERRVTFLRVHRAGGKGQRHLCQLQLLWCSLCGRE